MPPAETRIPYPGLADFSVDDEGGVVMVRIQGNRLLLRCHRGSGFVGEELVVAQTPSEAVLAPGDTQPHQLVFKDTGGGRPMVVLSRAGGHALVTWWVSRPGGSSRRGPSSRAIDARRCAAMTPPFAWSADPTEGDYLYDTAIDDAGRFVLFGRTKTWDGLRVMAADGTLLHQVSAPCPKGSNGYGRHVAMNQVTGDGVVTCQGHSSDPIHFRRFTFAQLPAMLDPGWVPVEGSGGGMSAWYESHVVGMNDEGGFAIEWSACPINYLLANTYDADARIVHKFQLGPVGDRCWDPFRDNRASIGVVNGGFLFRDGERGYNTAWTHSPSGLRRLQATLPADYEIDLLRASGESDVWGATNAGTIVWHPVNLVLRTTDRKYTKVSTSCPEGTVQVADATPTRDITCGTPKPVPPAAGGDTPTSCPPPQAVSRAGHGRAVVDGERHGQVPVAQRVRGREVREHAADRHLGSPLFGQACLCRTRVRCKRRPHHGSAVPADARLRERGVRIRRAHGHHRPAMRRCPAGSGVDWPAACGVPIAAAHRL